MSAKSIELVLIVTDHLPLQADLFVKHNLIDRALRPFLDWMDAFPRIKVGFQFSQGLRNEIISDADLKSRLDAYLADERIEWLSGSPVHAHLHSLPKGSAQVHLERDLSFLKKHYEYEPSGFYPYGLCWDNDLISELSVKNIRYCLVDRSAIETSLGWTERHGIRCGVIGIDHELSRIVPWAHPRYFFRRLQKLAINGDRVSGALFTLENMGERLNSHALCWQENRMNALGTAMMRAQNWLRSVLPRKALKSQDARVYPIPGCRRYKGFSPWERDLATYPITGRLHSLMVLLTDEIKLLNDKLRQDFSPGLMATIQELRDDLYMAQSAMPRTPYPIGSLELPASRHLVWERLERAYREAELHTNPNNTVSIKHKDLDCDGEDEVWIRTQSLRVNVNPRLTGGVGYCSAFGKPTIVNVLNRREMPWHQHMDAHQCLPSLANDLPIVETSKPHELIPTPNTILSRLIRDNIERGLFIDQVFDHRLTKDNLRNGLSPTVPLTFKSPYRISRIDSYDDHVELDVCASISIMTLDGERSISLQKKMTIYKRMAVIDVEYILENTGLEPIDVLWTSGFTFNIDGVITPERYFFLEPSPVRFNLLKHGERLSANSATWRLGDVGVQMQMWPDSRVVFHPIEMPLVDASGVVMRYQGHCAVNIWPLQLWSNEKASFGVSIQFESLT